MRPFAFLLGVVLLAGSSHVLALDRERALEAARKALGEKCAADDACTFDATRVEGKWRVRVDFAQAGAAKGKSRVAPVILLINDTGRIVGRIGAAAP